MFNAATEHPPPHFHAVYAEYDVAVNIRTGEVMHGKMPRRQLRMVQAWAELHREELLANWQLSLDGENPIGIEPLK